MPLLCSLCTGSGPGRFLLLSSQDPLIFLPPSHKDPESFPACLLKVRWQIYKVQNKEPLHVGTVSYLPFYISECWSLTKKSCEHWFKPTLSCIVSNLPQITCATFSKLQPSMITLTYLSSINTKMGMIIGTYMVTFVGCFLSLWTKGNPRWTRWDVCL